MDATRNLIDYAMDDNGVEFRSQLYATIHDKVTAAIEAKKQEIAGSLIRQEEKEHSDAAEDKKMIDKEIKKKMKTEESDEEKGEKAEKKEERPNQSKGPSALGSHFGRKSSSGGKTTETKTGRVHTSGDRY
jgi:hypothetical protein